MCASLDQLLRTAGYSLTAWPIESVSICKSHNPLYDLNIILFFLQQMTSTTSLRVLTVLKT